MSHKNAELIIGLWYDYGTLFKMEISEEIQRSWTTQRYFVHEVVKTS